MSESVFLFFNIDILFCVKNAEKINMKVEIFIEILLTVAFKSFSKNVAIWIAVWWEQKNFFIN